MSDNQQQEAENSSLRQIVELDGKKYVITGHATFNVVPLEQVEPVPPVDPKPEPDKPIDPNQGTIKEGSKWSKNPGNASEWKVVEMGDADKKGLFKLVDKEGLNVIADLVSQKVAEALKKYFETNPFPPKTDTPDKPDKPDPIPPVIEGQVVEGVKLPYEITGKVKVNDFHWNKRDDGLRCDHEDLGKNGEFVNNLMVFYGTFKGSVPKDEIAFKWSWGTHSGKGALVKCYGIRLKNESGETDYRMEWEHPDYTKPLAEGEKGLTPQKGKSLGYMGVRKTLANGHVLLQYWQDEGGLVDGKPANKWVKKLEFVDKEYKVVDYSKNGIECTVRIDDNKGWENIQVDKVLLVELKP